MKALKFAVMLPWLFLLAGVAMAATQYGEATLEQGAMTIVREGQTLRFDQVNQRIPVNEEDLIRVRSDSRVLLKSRENATVTLGSNAVFHVKPWQSHGQSGFVRALFGRFKASIVGLTGGQQFNVKTATATIGVKGTEYLTSITSRGGTLLIVKVSTVDLQGQLGGGVNVGPDLISLVLNVKIATPPVPVPPEVNEQFNDTNLDAPPPNSPGGQDFPGENGLINAGIVTQEDLDSGKGNSAGGPPQIQTPQVPIINIPGQGALPRANVRLQFN